MTPNEQKLAVSLSLLTDKVQQIVNHVNDLIPAVNQLNDNQLGLKNEIDKLKEQITPPKEDGIKC